MKKNILILFFILNTFFIFSNEKLSVKIVNRTGSPITTLYATSSALNNWDTTNLLGDKALLNGQEIIISVEINVANYYYFDFLAVDNTNNEYLILDEVVSRNKVITFNKNQSIGKFQFLKDESDAAKEDTVIEREGETEISYEMEGGDFSLPGNYIEGFKNGFSSGYALGYKQALEELKNQKENDISKSE